MKKINRSLSNYYLPVKLYLNDLFEIEAILKESSEHIKIEVEDYQFSSVEELSENLHNKIITELELSNEYASIYLKPTTTSLHVQVNNITGSGLFYKLDSLLRKKRRPLWFLYSYYILIPFPTIIIYLLNPYLFIDKTFRYILITIFVLSFFWIVFIRINRNSLVIISENNSITNLWTRKKDDLLLIIIGAILGAIGTLIVNLLFK